MRSVLALLLVALALACTTRAKNPAATPTPAPVAAAPDIHAAAFLAGTWQSDSAEHGFNEESWSAPRGNNMVGTFRWLKPDGTPSLFELITITAEGETLNLRLRHHNAKLEGWKAEVETNKPLELVLKEAGENRLLFAAAEGSTLNNGVASTLYQRTGDTLHIEIAFVDPKRQTLAFDLKRAP